VHNAFSCTPPQFKVWREAAAAAAGALRRTAVVVGSSGGVSADGSRVWGVAHALVCVLRETQRAAAAGLVGWRLAGCCVLL
jgi:hypothetical protein